MGPFPRPELIASGRRLAASKAIDGQESAEGVALAAAVERRTMDDEAGQMGSDDED